MEGSFSFGRISPTGPDFTFLEIKAIQGLYFKKSKIRPTLIWVELREEGDLLSIPPKSAYGEIRGLLKREGYLSSINPLFRR